MGSIRMRYPLHLAGLAFLSVASLHAGTVTFATRNAVVWGQDQVINGRVSPAVAGAGILYVNGTQVPFSLVAPGDSFSVAARIGAGTNCIVARVDSMGVPWFSDTLRLTLGYSLRPEFSAYSTIAGQTATLHGALVAHEDSSLLSFSWTQDPRNPSQVTLGNASDSVASATFPPGVKTGEYFFTLTIGYGQGLQVNARTIVTVDSAGLRPFNIRTDHASWIDSAIVYGITPYNFVAFGTFQDITNKIPDLALLGINTLWIQPVYATYGGGQGYDVTDYFSVRSDLGTPAALQTLVQTAHTNGIRVLLDFVPNHTSIYHPYAQDAIAYGPESHYYDFYQRVPDGAAYSSNEVTRTMGLMQFVRYFWPDLPNLNYDNPEVRRMITEAGKYWIEQFGIDGYRVDAAWAVNARDPDFFTQWRLALKRIRPDILLLAEDKASVLNGDPNNRPCDFDQRFDAAYDWTREMGWVSHWVWQSTYSSSSNPTIFNTAAFENATALRNSLTNNGAGYDPRARIFRFMENNDTFRFRATHDDARTRMVAAMMFSLAGIPSIFNGQEIGFATHPYSTFAIFNGSSTIPSQDQYGLFPYYRFLVRLRKRFPELMTTNLQETSVTPQSTVYAYRRWDGLQNIFTLVNMSSSATTATLQLPIPQMGLDTTKTYYLTDLVTNEFLTGTLNSLSNAAIALNGFNTRLLVLADSVVHTLGVEPLAGAAVPSALELAQNYPNPFNPSTSIRYDLPRAGAVNIVVFDILGRQVATLLEGNQGPGRHEVTFNADRLASGVYFCRLGFEGQSRVRKMMLLK